MACLAALVARRIGVDRRQRSAAAVSTCDFVVGWREDRFDLSVPLSRDRVQPGESARDDCVMRRCRRVAAASEGPVVAVLLRVEGPAQGGTLTHLLNRP